MMKKIIILLVVFSLTTLLSSCAANTSPENNEADNNSSQTEEVNSNQNEEQEDIDYTKLVEEYVSEDVTKKVGELDVKYSFHLPKILDKSEGADKINAIIEDKYAKEIKKIMESSDDEAKYYDINWKSYWSSNIVSIVISAKLNPAEEEERLVLSYNFETNQVLENDDILKYVGLEKDEFISLAKDAIIKRYDSCVKVKGYTYDDLMVTYSEYLPLRSYSISNVNDDDVYLYLDNDSLKMIAQSYSPEIAGAYYHDYSIDVDNNKNYPTKKINDEFISIRLENNKVFISLDFALQSKGYLIELTESDANKEHEVEGLYGDYKDIKIGVIGQDYYPILILTKEDDSLELVNVLECARSKKFVSMPLFGLHDIKEVYDDVVEFGEGGYITISAKDSSSNTYDLSEWLFGSAFSFSTNFISRDPNSPYVTVKSDNITHSTQSGGEYTSRYELKIAEIELIINDISDEAGIQNSHLLEGLNCLGMNDEGLFYTYYMFEENADKISVTKDGCLAVRYCSDLLDEIEAKVIHGPELFDSPNEWIKFLFSKTK